MEELLNQFFGEIAMIVSVVGLIVISFVLSVMFDDKQRFKFNLKGFVQWLRTANTTYEEPEKK